MMLKRIILSKCKVMLHEQESSISIFIPNQNYEIGWHILRLNQIKLFLEELIAQDAWIM